MAHRALLLFVSLWSSGLCAVDNHLPAVTAEVRLVGGASHCAGGLETKQQEEWTEVEMNPEWNLTAADAVCRQLNCGSVILLRGIPYSTVQINCSDSVRLVEGTNMCSGRVEVKSNQSWSSVCEEDFNQQNAEVVCRELGCGAPSVFKGGLYGAAEAPVWMRKLQCGGHESALLDCGSSRSTENTCSPGKAVGLTCSDPDDVRLVGGANRCSGRLEVKHNGDWRGVELDNDWTLKTAGAICQKFDCGSPVSRIRKVHSQQKEGPFFGQPVWLIRTICIETKSERKDCFPSHAMSAFSLEITCSDSVRLVEGTNMCSGRVEVKSNQSWSSVCEEDFNQQNAEVVCRELGCGAPSVFKGGLYGAAEAPVWMRKFLCRGHESALLDCGSSRSTENTCSPGKAVGLTCSDPDDVRLMGGANRCSGRLEVKKYGDWKEVSAEFSGWTMKTSAVICQRLDCGSPVLAGHKDQSSPRSVWRVKPSCMETKTKMNECVQSETGRHFTLEITCSDSVRLVEGTNICSGRLEVKSDQSWSSVCEDDFNQQNAEVVCRELGCGAPSVLQGTPYGEVVPPVWSKEFRCEGNESALLDCDSSNSATSGCSPGKAVGLTCSDPVSIRLVGEKSRCAGSLEMKHLREWRPVDDKDSAWNQRSAAAVCMKLGCGSAVSTRETTDSSSSPMWAINSCIQSSFTLWECIMLDDQVYNVMSIARLEVICSELLAQPHISLSATTDGVSQDERQGFWVLVGYTFGIMCSVEPQYQGGSFQLVFTSSNTAQNYTLPAVNHSALFLFSAADHTHRGTYICIYHNYVFNHNFSSVSQPGSLAVLVSAPLTELIIRVTVVLLVMTSSTTALYFYYKPKPEAVSREQ